MKYHAKISIKISIIFQALKLVPSQAKWREWALSVQFILFSIEMLTDISIGIYRKILDNDNAADG